jgi:ABC-type multidrug transport system fused ATPase/permease subunit
MTFFELIPSAVLMARITNDVKNLPSVSSKVIADLARETTTLIALLIVIFWRDYKLASISIFDGKNWTKAEKTQQEKAGIF